MTYRTMPTATLILAALCLLGIVWQPVGSWWQWLATALVLTFVAAGFSNAADGQEDK